MFSNIFCLAYAKQLIKIAKLYWSNSWNRYPCATYISKNAHRKVTTNLRVIYAQVLLLTKIEEIRITPPIMTHHITDFMYSIEGSVTSVRIFNIHESSNPTGINSHLNLLIFKRKMCMLSNLFLLSSYLNIFNLFLELHSTADVYLIFKWYCW